MLILTNSALAQNLEISIIGYNPDTNFARVQIKNLLQQDLHNLRIQIDAFPEEPFVNLLEKGNIVVYNSNIPEGIHTIKITSNEMIETKDLSFSASAIEKQEAYQKEQIERRREIQQERLIEEKSEVTTKTPINYKTIIASLVTLAIIGIIFYLIKKKNE